MQDKIIAFIGGGNMTRSLVSGLIKNQFNPKHIWVSNPSADKLVFFKERLGVNVTQDNMSAAQQADILIFAVKPQQIKAVSQQLASIIQQTQPLLISIAAGIPTSLLAQWLGDTVAIVRAMPNTPSLVGAGAAGLYANAQVNVSQRDNAESILRAVGLALWLEDEQQLRVVSALSGSGPAYLFLIMEALQKAAGEMGLAEDTARILTLQMVLGSTRLALESEQALSQLRDAVTSPGGTTEQALKVLESGQLSTLLNDALAAACQRAQAIEQAQQD